MREVLLLFVFTVRGNSLNFKTLANEIPLTLIFTCKAFKKVSLIISGPLNEINQSEKLFWYSIITRYSVFQK